MKEVNNSIHPYKSNDEKKVYIKNIFFFYIKIKLKGEMTVLVCPKVY